MEQIKKEEPEAWSILQAAGVDEAILATFEQGDLKYLFDGPEKFMLRRKLRKIIEGMVIEEVRRTLGLKENDFVEKSVSALLQKIDSIIYYGINKGALKPPRNPTVDGKVVHLMKGIRCIFRSIAKMSTKQIKAEEIFDVVQDDQPDDWQKKCSIFIPALFITDSGAAVLLEREILAIFQESEFGKAVVMLIAAFYLMDLDYPADWMIPMSLLQRLTFEDNTVRVVYQDETAEALNSLEQYYSRFCSAEVVEAFKKRKGTSSCAGSSKESFPIGELNPIVYKYVCTELTKQIPGKDYKALAGHMGYTTSELKTFELNKDPADAVLSDWGTKSENDVHKLMMILNEMERDDIVGKLREQVDERRGRNLMKRGRSHKRRRRKQSDRSCDGDLRGEHSRSRKERRRKQSDESRDSDLRRDNGRSRKKRRRDQSDESSDKDRRGEHGQSRKGRRRKQIDESSGGDLHGEHGRSRKGRHRKRSDESSDRDLREGHRRSRKGRRSKQSDESSDRDLRREHSRSRKERRKQGDESSNGDPRGEHGQNQKKGRLKRSDESRDSDLRRERGRSRKKRRRDQSYESRDKDLLGEHGRSRKGRRRKQIDESSGGDLCEEHRRSRKRRRRKQSDESSGGDFREEHRRSRKGRRRKQIDESSGGDLREERRRSRKGRRRKQSDESSGGDLCEEHRRSRKGRRRKHSDESSDGDLHEGHRRSRKGKHRKQSDESSDGDLW